MEKSPSKSASSSDFVEVLAVTKDNLRETVVADGFSPAAGDLCQPVKVMMSAPVIELRNVSKAIRWHRRAAWR